MLGAGMPPTCGVVLYVAWNAKCGDGVLASAWLRNTSALATTSPVPAPASATHCVAAID